MAVLLRISAVLVLLAGAYSLYADFIKFASGQVSGLAYLGKLVLAVVIAIILWIFARRAANINANSDASAEFD